MPEQIVEAYLEQCLSPHSDLAGAMGRAKLPEHMREAAGHRLLHRPLLVHHRELHSFAADVVALFDLITSLPQRLFDGDLDRYCAALRIDDQRATLMRRLGDQPPPRYGRADMYHDGDAFRLLEFNIASELGGIDRAGQIPAALLDDPTFATFAAAHGLRYTHTGRHVAQALRAAGQPVAAGREPTVALLEGPGGMASYGAYWRAFQESMRALGLDLRIGEVGDVRERNGKIVVDGAAVDVVLRCFSVDEICADPHGPELVEPLFRAHEQGRVVLWTPMASSLYGNKGCLALLSDPRWQASYTPAELALVDRVLPWTRTLHTGPGSADLHERCLHERASLILKPPGGYGGSGIVAGWECTDAQWRDAVRDGAEHGAIVQRRVVPRDEPVVDPDTREVSQWQAAWGLFVTPAGYAGAYARALPTGEQAVIGIGANAATRTAAVFGYGD